MLTLSGTSSAFFAFETTTWMKNLFFTLLLFSAALMADGCATMQQPRSEAITELGIYKISTPGSSRKILAETMKNAIAQCDQEDKHYLFVRNIFPQRSTLGHDTGSYTLYFTCVEAEDPRLKQQRKSRQQPKEEEAVEEQPEQKIPHMDQNQVQPESPSAEKIVPKKEKTPAPQQEASPATEPARKKPVVRPGKKAAPGSKKQPSSQKKNNEPQKTDEEQSLRKNPGPGELEDLRKDGSDLYDEQRDSRIIEEALAGEDPLYMENYLKRRLRKKKKTN
ncbi:MAG: hypothetical protein A2505_05755 [Deltaproteobacteria bacterium RIFOXYD12_FULL_55_16]|nr:MAG: hypothetical protein A2505_05755 [Deltaproteobacteria bacterium RIFOXYD12_FULL_55_16]